MNTKHTLIIGNSIEMPEIPSSSIHLMLTSPPYYNAPFDYKDLYNTYENYLDVLRGVAKETFRVLQSGRIAVVNIDDMLVNGEKYPIVADTIRIFLDAGFRYRDKLVWKKPDGYIRISRRSGVLLQNPYPMYFYPDNLLESIVIFQKGKFDYRSIDTEIREKSKININEFKNKKWFLTLWEMTNVLPGSDLERNIAAFPEELPYRIIKLFSYVGEKVLDPFVGSGTTMKMARKLGRNSVGYDIQKSVLPIVQNKVGFNGQMELDGNTDRFEIIIRDNNG